MAANVEPSLWLGPGLSFASHVLSLTNSAGANPVLTQLTDAKADPTTGDIREIFFAMAQAMYAAWQTQIAANNRPIQMNLTRSQSGDSSGNTTYAFNFQFTVTPTGIFTIPVET